MVDGKKWWIRDKRINYEVGDKNDTLIFNTKAEATEALKELDDNFFIMEVVYVNTQ